MVPALKVGDHIEYESQDQSTHNIISLLPRKNTLLQPAVTNIDLVYVVLAAKDPVFRLDYLDSLLMLYHPLPVHILINKMDIADHKEVQVLHQYVELGYPLIMLTATELDIATKQKLSEEMRGKTVLLAGQSGVGKSSLLKQFCAEDIVVSAVSEKIKRGKQTTKQSSMYYVKDNEALLIDSPGFSMADLRDYSAQQVLAHFQEFDIYGKYCKYSDCRHLAEPECKVKQAVMEGKIARSRYESYQSLMARLEKNRKR